MSEGSRVLSYKDSINEMYNTKEKNIHMINALIQGLSATNPVVSKGISDINNLPVNLPNKRIKKTIFFKTVEIGNNNYSATGFEKLWAQFQAHTFPPHGLAEFNKSVYSNVVKGLKDILNDYIKTMTKFDDIVKKANENLRYATNNQTKSYMAYRNLSNQIEDLYRKINNPTSPLKPEQEKKLKDNFNEFKVLYKTAFNNAVDGLRYLNMQRLEYSTNIETAFSVFEEADQMVYERVHALISQFRIQIQAYLNEKMKSFEPIEKSFTEPPPFNDLNTFYNDSNLQPIPFENAKVIDFNPKRAPFNMCEFVPPQKLFAKELQYYGAITIRDYKAKNKNEIDLSTNTVVTVLKTKKTKQVTLVKVFVDDLKITGLVPSYIIKVVPEMSRQLYRVKENYSDNDFFVCAGDIVLSIKIIDGNATCYDIYFKKGTIPLSNLTLFKK